MCGRGSRTVACRQRCAGSRIGELAAEIYNMYPPTDSQRRAVQRAVKALRTNIWQRKCNLAQHARELVQIEWMVSDSRNGWDYLRPNKPASDQCPRHV
jgi:hypothetical protein